jgi:hypothetical protein
VTADLKINFLEDMPLDEIAIRMVRGIVGLYFIYLTELRIPYPHRSSRLIYIGMSESKQNSIGNRLRDHKSGQSGNPGLTNYINLKPVRFSYHTFDFLNSLGIISVAELEGVFLRSFCSHHGSYPICNNQAGIELQGASNPAEFTITWQHFE